MKLTRRLNVILLPVILLVFSLAGVVVFSEYSKLKQVQLRNHWQQQLAFASKEIELEQRAFHSALSEVLNSNQLIRYLTSTNPNQHVFGFEESLHRMIARTQQHISGIDRIQIQHSDGRVLISADNQDPFETPKPIALPENYLQQLETTRAPVQQLLHSQDNSLRYTIALPFNEGLLADDALAKHSVGYFIAVLEGHLDALNHLEIDLSNQFGSSYKLQLLNQTELKQAAPFTVSTAEYRGPIKAEVTTADYQLRLTITEAALEAQRSYVLGRTFIVTSLLSLVSFVLLRWLISQQIINPINRLTKAVSRSELRHDVTLKHLNNDNEVASLNNAYLGLLNRVERMASSDPLTGLANRHSFEQWLQRMLTRTLPSNQLMALLYIDLDNFKRVNDQYGHATGDKLLLRFSQQLQRMIRPQDGLAHAQQTESFARLAGDEFALLLNALDCPEDALAIATRIQTRFSQGIEVEGVVHHIQSSIGIALCPSDAGNASQLLVNAEAAMRQAKHSGKNQSQFFSATIAKRMQLNRDIERLLRDALDNSSFELAYMPIFDCRSLTVSGVEVLLRCPTLTEQGIGPDQFIPVAESRGMIREIDLRVIEHAFQQMSRFKGTSLQLMAINISAMELNNSSFPKQVKALLEQYQIDPSSIELEITETSIIADDEIALSILNQLRELGLSLSLDDFGTGYTAFSQLANCPVDCLKIDRSFVNNVGQTSRNKRPMLDMILSLGQLYDLRVIAEGVETQEQLDYLQQQGCDQVQGFYLSKPLPLTDFIQLLQHQSARQKA